MSRFLKKSRMSTLALLVGLATTMTALPAGAVTSGTSLVTDTFLDASLSQVWVTPPGNGGITNSACLTASSNLAEAPVPGCPDNNDSAGSGVLRLTDSGNGREGGVFFGSAIPTAGGLDMSWDSFQYNGSGADGLNFVFGVADPSNPEPPSALGPEGGSLGYTGAGDATDGLPNAYMGFGADVFGNYEYFQGNGCTSPQNFVPGSMTVRGPGNGSNGYCLLPTATGWATQPLATGMLDNRFATSRVSGCDGGCAVPEEVVINPSSTATISAEQSGASVAPESWLFAVRPIGSSTWETLTGMLPTVGNDPNLASMDPSYFNAVTGLPRLLTFGWVASTGGLTEFHEITHLSVRSVTVAPVLALDSNTTPDGSSSYTVTLTPGVDTASPTSDGSAMTVVDTFPAGITPNSASGVGWLCTTAGQTVTCHLDPRSPILPGHDTPVIDVVVTAAASVSELSHAVRFTSDRGAPVAHSYSMAVSKPQPLPTTGFQLGEATGAALAMLALGFLCLDSRRRRRSSHNSLG